MSPRLTILAALLALAAGGAGAADAPQPAACQLRIGSVPEGAAVTVDGIARDVTPLVIADLASGEHLVTLTKPGYRTLRQTVTLTPDQRMALDLTLEPITGLVLVRSDPPDAEVRVDGVDRGRTPLLLRDLRLGSYSVEVQAHGYAARTLALDLKDRRPVLLDVALSSESATLRVESDPAGAKVLVNGIDAGETPCTVERLPTGDTFLKVEKEGYRPFDQMLKLAAGKTETVRLSLRPLPAELRVASIPPGARVYVNNQNRGTTPLTLSDLPSGECRVRVELEGYDPAARTVELVPAQLTAEEFRLEANMGTLELTTEPAGVRVAVNGREAGVTAPGADGSQRLSAAWTTNLPSGALKVQLSKEGYSPREIEITIERNAKLSRHERLVRLFIPDYEVTTAGGTEAGMLRGIGADGSIRLEVRPGVVKVFRATDVLSHRRTRATTP